MTIKTGTAASETLIGTTSPDQLFGKGGNDILKGLAGPDLLDGGTGTDTASYSGTFGAVTVLLDDGRGLGADADGDTYVSIENAVGSSSNDALHGNSLANKLDGGLGSDELFGNGGNDTLLGGDGSDQIEGGTGIELINGGSGGDILRYRGSALGVNVNLSTGVATGGDAAGDTITGIEGLVGSVANDVLSGTAGGNFLDGSIGTDRLFGFAGNDLLRGNGGADTMTGGDGADTFFFLQEDSRTGFIARDVINDFNHAQGDILDLRLIDANTQDKINDTFEFLGKDATIDAPGQISYSFVGGNTVVEMNTVGGFDSPPEIEIQLQGNINLVASDFFL